MSGPPESPVPPPGPVLVPAGLRRTVSDYILPSYGPRSRVSYPWSLETPMLGYTAPRLPVYASIVNLGKEKNRCASYYASNIAVPPPESSGSLRALAGGVSGQLFPGELSQVRDAAGQESQSHLTRPRSRRTVCVGQGFSLPPLLEEDASYGRCRSASVVMGTQAMTISSLKVNNIEKAERMKANERRKDLAQKDDVEVLNNIENTQKIKALEISQDPLRSESDESDASKEAAPKAREGEPTVASTKKVSFSDHGAATSPELTRPRVRLSYVEPSTSDEKSDTKAQQSKRKRLSWAAGDKGHKQASRESRSGALLNNERDAEGRRSRLSASEASTIYPRSEPSGDAPKFKKRLSWATSERKRFSWSPRSSSMDRGLDRRRYSFAGDESRRQNIRMGTRSLLSISSPVAGTLVHLAGQGVHQSSLLAAILDPDR